MSSFWSIWVIAIFAITVAGVCWVLFANRRIELDEPLKDDEPRKTGHVSDGIEEYDNPLPAWWFNMFVITVVFGVVYVLLYPGLGNFPGFLGWTSTGQWQQQEAEADQRFTQLAARFEDLTIEELSLHPEAVKIGARLFGNNCAVCHGSDGGGAYGFPDLTDKGWLYGGSPEAIETSIRNGRRGAMPAWSGVIDDEQINQVTEYLFKLSGRDHVAGEAAAGEKVYATYCAACHGADGGGNQALGAPDLSDAVWLYGRSPELIKASIRSGRQGVMPAQGEMLHAGKIRFLTAYVYGLSRQ